MLPDDRDFGPAMVIDQMSLSKVCFAEFSPDSQDSATSIQRGKLKNARSFFIAIA